MNGDDYAFVFEAADKNYDLCVYGVDSDGDTITTPDDIDYT